jgi:hypothetical protein
MRVFLSYSHHDKEYARRVIATLMKHNIHFWFDQYDILVGHSLHDKIFEGIRKSDYFLLILTPQSLKSDWVQKELSEALMQEMERKQTYILPLRFERCLLPDSLQNKHYADFTEFSKGNRELIKLLLDSTPFQKNAGANIIREFTSLWETYLAERKNELDSILERYNRAREEYNGDEESHVELEDTRHGIDEFLLELSTRALSVEEKNRILKLFQYESPTVEKGWAFTSYLTDKVKDVKSTPDIENAIITAIGNGYHEGTGLFQFSNGGNNSLFRSIMIHSNLYHAGFLTPEEREDFLYRPLEGFTKSPNNDGIYCRRCGTLLSEKYDHLETSRLTRSPDYYKICNNRFCPDYGKIKKH